MALLGGISGGATRDLILNKVPGASTNPAYLVLCLAAGVIGYLVAYTSGQLFREGLFQFMTSFSLPWYAPIGAQAGTAAGLPIVGALALAIIGPTAGRYFIDVSSGVHRSSSFVASGSSARHSSRGSSGSSAMPLGCPRGGAPASRSSSASPSAWPPSTEAGRSPWLRNPRGPTSTVTAARCWAARSRESRNVSYATSGWSSRINGPRADARSTDGSQMSALTRMASSDRLTAVHADVASSPSSPLAHPRRRPKGRRRTTS